MKTDKIKNHFARKSDYLNVHEARDMGDSMLNKNLDSEYFQIHSAQSAMDQYGPNVPPLRYPYYYIAIVKSGEALMSIDLTEFQIKGYTVFYFKPKQVVSLSIKSNQIEGYFITFSDLFTLGWNVYRDYLRSSNLYENGNMPFFYPSLSEGNQLYQIFEELYIESREEKKSKQELVKIKLLELLFKTERMLPSQNHSLSKAFSRKKSSEEYFIKFKALLESSTKYSLSVSDYASLLSISPNHLNKVCKLSAGKTTSQLISDYILLEAKSLLIHTTLTISEISFNLGFEDPSHFYKFFKKNTNISPSEFRTNRR